MIPTSALVEEAKAFQYGIEHKKYPEASWRKSPIRYSTYIDAALRHILAVIEADTWNDPESGIPHLAHARANLAILLDAKACGTAYDDRQKGPNTKKS